MSRDRDRRDMSPEPDLEEGTEGRKIFVGGLSLDVSESDLYKGIINMYTVCLYFCSYLVRQCILRELCVSVNLFSILRVSVFSLSTHK